MRRAIDEIDVPLSADANGIRETIAREMWDWYYDNIDDVILSVRLLFWRRAFTVRDLRPIFVRLFGEPASE
jgi:hypothetical protein